MTDLPVSHSSMESSFPHQGDDDLSRDWFLSSSAYPSADSGSLSNIAFGTVIFVNLRVSQRTSAMAVRLTSLEDLPLNGPPKLFQVVAHPANSFANGKSVGSVFLHRVEPAEVRAVEADSPGSSERDPLDVEIRGEEVWVSFRSFTRPTTVKSTL